MAYCAICGRNHSPDMACAASTQQGLPADGKKRRRRRDRPQFKESAKKADWIMGLIAVAVMAAVISLIVL